MTATMDRAGAADVSLDWTDFYHTGPGTLAGRWLRTFWHPAFRSQDLPVAWPKPVQVMSEEFTLYRGHSGAPHAVGFRCAHRRTQLSSGWVEGEDIRCFFHGWKYSADGRCIEQPAEPEPFFDRIRIGSYPLQEYMGLIFVYMGEGEPPPLPRYPDFEEGAAVETKLRAGNYYNHLGFDTAHSAFVHARGRDSWSQDGFHLPTVVETEWGMSPVHRRSEHTRHLGHHGIPNLSQHIRFEEGGMPDVLRWVVPVDDDHNRDFSVFKVVGEAARRYQERRGPGYTETSDRADELTRKILAGELRIEDVEREEARSAVTNVQDSVAQIGMGPISERQFDILGRADAGLLLRKQVFERELRALAEGHPLKQWLRTERFSRDHADEFIEDD